MQPSTFLKSATRTLVASISLLLPCTAGAQPANVRTSAPAASLAATYKDDFLIGVATDFTDMNSLTPSDLELIKTQFNQITPENSMKPGFVHPEEDRWTFGQADKLVDFCQQNHIQVVGHCLAWHGETGRWFFVDKNGQPVSRQKAIERLKTHITTEVSRYKGKVKGWDVVNEAIGDRGPGDTENLRDTPWLRAIGPDYIKYAFEYAHEADPNAELYYNDYSIEKGNKHQSSLLLLKRLISQGAHIKAVGIQGHWSLDYLPYEELDKAIDDYKALGLHVNISELDITITGQGGGQLNPATGPSTRPTTAPGRRRRFAGFNGPIVPPTHAQLEAQAKAYAKLFEIFQKHKDVIDRVTFWGINDARSWRRGQAPLIFDGNDQPKPAFNAIMAAKQ